MLSSTAAFSITRPPLPPTLFPYTTLFRSGDKSLWVACRFDPSRLHVARVRSDVPAPPPAGIERRSPERLVLELAGLDRKSTRLNSSHTVISYAVFCLKKKCRLGKSGSQRS